MVIVGLNETLQVGDFSLHPSVSLDVDIPECIDGSFYHGQVHIGLKENAFEASTSLRHAVELNMALAADGRNNPVECHYHDGGPDHNLRYTRTQLTQIAYFLKRDLDVLVLVQTLPHHSWKNPAERVMSNLNLGLQGVGLCELKKVPKKTSSRRHTTWKKLEILKINALAWRKKFATPFNHAKIF